MLRGPQGQTRKGDVAQVAHQVFRFAVGEDGAKEPSGKRRSGLAGAKALWGRKP
jgi:hypothetical protein